MIGNVIKNHLPMRNIGACKTCIHWKDPYQNASYSEPNWQAGYCRRPNQKQTAIGVSGEDFGCIHWEGEQRIGDETANVIKIDFNEQYIIVLPQNTTEPDKERILRALNEFKNNKERTFLLLSGGVKLECVTSEQQQKMR